MYVNKKSLFSYISIIFIYLEINIFNFYDENLWQFIMAVKKHYFQAWWKMEKGGKNFTSNYLNNTNLSL